MSYNLDKSVSVGARKAAKTTFGLCGALVGFALGVKPSSRRSRPSGLRRPKRPWWW